MEKNEKKKIALLEERIRILELENNSWTERAEETFLVSKVMESILQLESRKNIIQMLLEKISILKHISYCVYGVLNCTSIKVENEYASFYDGEKINPVIEIDNLSAEELSIKPFLHKHLQLDFEKFTSADITLKENLESFWLFPFKSVEEKNGVMIFSVNKLEEHPDRFTELVQNILQVTLNLIDKNFLLEQISNQNNALEKRIEEKTLDLKKVNAILLKELDEKKQKDKEILESEQRFQALSNSTFEGIVISKDGLCIDVNLAGRSLFGYCQDEFVNLELDKIIAPESRELNRQKIEEGNEKPYEVFAIKKDGTKFEAEVQGRGLMYKENLVRINAFRDITQRKKAENELKQSQMFKKRLVNSSPDLIYVFDIVENANIYSNEGIMHILGYSISELKEFGNRLLELLLHPDDIQEYVEKVKPLYAGLKENESIENEYRMKHKDGHWVWLSSKESIFDRQPDGSPKSIFGITRDISERKKADNEKKELMQELKFRNDELEQMLYASTHDLRIPLVNIQGFSRELIFSFNEIRNCLKEIEMPVEIKHRIDEIVEREAMPNVEFMCTGVNKMDSLLNALLQFSRLGRVDLKIEEIDMNRLMKEVVEANFFETRKNNIKVILSDLPKCHTDLTQINNVFSNLISNSNKYYDPDKDSYIRIYGEEEDESIVYTIEDNGVGIPEKKQEEIFKMFYRMDNNQEGLGIGLTIVKKIIHQLNGKVTLESEPGLGSKFKVHLPAKIEND